MSPIDNAFPNATREEIIESWSDHPWYPAIKRCHDELLYRDPGYQLIQIKEKFGGLRYYWEPSGNDYSDERKIRMMEESVIYAEGWVNGYEKGVRSK